jgi:hypothetical protein
MPRSLAVPSVAALVLLVVLFGGRARGQTDDDATPVAGTPAPGSPGVGFDVRPLAFAPLDTVPFPPAVLGLLRATLAPGAHQDAGADPGATLTYVESGALSIRLEGPATVLRAAAGGAPEEVGAGADVTLGAGDAILVPRGTRNAARNDGAEPAVLLVVLLASEAALGAPPAGTPAAATPAAASPAADAAMPATVAVAVYGCGQAVPASSASLDALRAACADPLAGVTVRLRADAESARQTVGGTAAWRDVAPGPITLAVEAPAEYASVVSYECDYDYPLPGGGSGGGVSAGSGGPGALDHDLRPGEELRCAYYLVRRDAIAAQPAAVVVAAFACPAGVDPAAPPEAGFAETCREPLDGVTVLLAASGDERTAVTEAGSAGRDGLGAGAIALAVEPTPGYGPPAFSCGYTYGTQADTGGGAGGSAGILTGAWDHDLRPGERVDCDLYFPLAGAAASPAAAAAEPAASPTAAAAEPTCAVAPRTADEVVALLFPDGTPAAGATSAATVEVGLPLGAPADPATAAAVEATVREFVACVNAGEFGRFLALLSDAFLVRELADPGLTADDWRAALGLPPELLASEAPIRVVAVTDVSVAPDGRVVAVVVADDPTGPPEAPESSLFYFVQVGDRWLVDGAVDFTEEAE